MLFHSIPKYRLPNCAQRRVSQCAQVGKLQSSKRRVSQCAYGRKFQSSKRMVCKCAQGREFQGFQKNGFPMCLLQGVPKFQKNGLQMCQRQKVLRFQKEWFPNVPKVGSSKVFKRRVYKCAQDRKFESSKRMDFPKCLTWNSNKFEW